MVRKREGSLQPSNSIRWSGRARNESAPADPGEKSPKKQQLPSVFRMSMRRSGQGSVESSGVAPPVNASEENSATVTMTQDSQTSEHVDGVNGLPCWENPIAEPAKEKPPRLDGLQVPDLDDGYQDATRSVRSRNSRNSRSQIGSQRGTERAPEMQAHIARPRSEHRPELVRDTRSGYFGRDRDDLEDMVVTCDDGSYTSDIDSITVDFSEAEFFQEHNYGRHSRYGEGSRYGEATSPRGAYTHERRSPRRGNRPKLHRQAFHYPDEIEGRMAYGHEEAMHDHRMRSDMRHRDMDQGPSRRRLFRDSAPPAERPWSAGDSRRDERHYDRGYSQLPPAHVYASSDSYNELHPPPSDYRSTSSYEDQKVYNGRDASFRPDEQHVYSGAGPPLPERDLSRRTLMSGHSHTNSLSGNSEQTQFSMGSSRAKAKPNSRVWKRGPDNKWVRIVPGLTQVKEDCVYGCSSQLQQYKREVSSRDVSRLEQAMLEEAVSLSKTNVDDDEAKRLAEIEQENAMIELAMERSLQESSSTLTMPASPLLQRMAGEKMLKARTRVEIDDEEFSSGELRIGATMAAKADGGSGSMVWQRGPNGRWVRAPCSRDLLAGIKPSESPRFATDAESAQLDQMEKERIELDEAMERSMIESCASAS